MKRIILIIGILVGIISVLVSLSAQSHSKPGALKLNAGIITTKTI